MAGLVRCLWLVFALTILSALGYAEPAATNRPARWPSLVEVKQKWANVSLTEIEQAANRGDLTAQHYLGYCYTEGFRFAKNTPSGMSYYERAAKAGYLPSWNNLALMYQQGNGVPRDLEKAIGYYRMAIEGGFAHAKVNLASLYDQDKSRPDQAIPLLQAVADSGDASAMTALYVAYANGRGVAVNRGEALKWLAQAAEAGDAYGQCLLGARYENPEWEKNGDQFVRLPPPNWPEAVRWYRRSADQGWAGGQYYLGLCYIEGHGVEQDEERGLGLLRLAADQDHVYAEMDLAGLYARGIGMPRNDEDRPIALLQRVVKGNLRDNYGKIREAYDLLIFRYVCGVGTERDLYVATEWYCQAALAGMENYAFADLLQNVPRKSRFHEFFRGDTGGQLLERVWPECKNDDHLLAAVSEYLKAVVSHDHAGLVQIGQKYLDGQGAPHSPQKAWLWFSLAAAKGAPGAAAKVAEVEEQLAAEELSDAKQQLPAMIREFEGVAAELGNGGPMEPNAGQ
jgi:TPR repeat protein